MTVLQRILIVFVVLEHFFILFMEMFAWNTLGKKTFKDVFSDDLFEQTTVMAANQGLYNGFLASGLLWTLFIANKIWRFNISVFFLCCVILAGIYGCFTIQTKIFFTQAIPAIITLIVTLFNFKKSK